MCGITGIYTFYKEADNFHEKISLSINSLKHRGPNAYGIVRHKDISLGHTRLSIIDTSKNANQPVFDASNNYAIVFNGEIYNYKEYRKILETKSYQFKTNSDTEVLLYMYVEYGVDFLQKINGCFSIAILDKNKEELIIARDRYGIKPLYIYTDAEKLIFASEMKAIMAYDIEKNINFDSLLLYFQLNYIPGASSIFNNVFRLTPGTYLRINNKGVSKNIYYNIPYTRDYNSISYEDAKTNLKDLIYNSVEQRLVADVPLGTFLSGGVDSSIITGIASEFKSNINSFSIGYKDEPYFDETDYALEVAKKFGTNHHPFKLSNNDLYENLFNILDSIDEPFADSSAIPVYILSKLTKQHVTVALSGDGADEIFSGYNKHMAHFNANNNSFSNLLLKAVYPITKNLSEGRNSSFSNKIRQVNKYVAGLKLSEKERYWFWASLYSDKNSRNLFTDNYKFKKVSKYIHELSENIEGKDFNDILFSDVNMVLQNDMLTKVDLMSMANGLEVRTPFLDHNIVDFAFNLPSKYKINGNMKKRILQDSFKDFLPNRIYNRPKHGFEVPLLKWFKTELYSLINDDLLNIDFIKSQNIFDYNEIEKLKQKLFSNNPQDVHAQIWALIVFQNWWKRYINM